MKTTWLQRLIDRVTLGDRTHEIVIESAIAIRILKKTLDAQNRKIEKLEKLMEAPATKDQIDYALGYFKKRDELVKGWFQELAEELRTYSLRKK